ncbi:hypothetical protein M0811_13635 [Anaeramoeba ignava]|uniref:Uncharacterized protein n=1 Tax=Anaeramoeba ignava TaxID=1746090 RepID=A0A9Q0L542_ANAIG|nr:hypothetical protein M0811_13635 [Anaeramoeba ignava]
MTNLLYESPTPVLININYLENNLDLESKSKEIKEIKEINIEKNIEKNQKEFKSENLIDHEIIPPRIHSQTMPSVDDIVIFHKSYRSGRSKSISPKMYTKLKKKNFLSIEPNLKKNNKNDEN